jgi:hypothetical protein
MMFLDCPAYLGDEAAARCGLPAEVRCNYTMQSRRPFTFRPSGGGPQTNALVRSMLTAPEAAASMSPFLNEQNGWASRGDSRPEDDQRAGVMPVAGRPEAGWAP